MKARADAIKILIEQSFVVDDKDLIPQRYMENVELAITLTEI